MRSRRACALCALLTLTTAPVAGQERRAYDTALATLCMVDWSIGPIWAGARHGCPPVLDALAAPDRPCRTRYTTGDRTREEARLRYDTHGRLREVEHVGRRRATYTYDAEGRLTAHTRQTFGYPPSTTSFTYAPGAIADDTTGSNERHRGQFEAGRVRSEASVQGAPDAPPMSVARWVYENNVFVGVDAVLCRAPAREGAPCEPAGPTDRIRVTRDRAGRITRRTNGDITHVYTYDARGRVARIRSASARFHDEMQVDYVCAER